MLVSGVLQLGGWYAAADTNTGAGIQFQDLAITPRRVAVSVSAPTPANPFKVAQIFRIINRKFAAYPAAEARLQRRDGIRSGDQSSVGHYTGQILYTQYNANNFWTHVAQCTCLSTPRLNV